MAIGLSLSLLALIIFQNFFFEINLNNIFSVYFFVYFFFSINAFYFIKKWIKIPKKYINLSKIFKFAYPFGLIAIFSIAVTLLERIYIFNNLNLKDLAIYAMAVKVSFIAHIFTQSFNMSWGPSAFKNFKKNEFEKLSNLILKIYLVISLIVMAFILTLGERIILFISSEKYLDSYNIIFPLTLAVLIQGINEITSMGIHLAKKTIMSLYSYLLYLICFSFICYIFILDYGLSAVAWSFLIANIILFFMESIISFNIYRIKFEYIKIFVCFVVINLIYFLIIYYIDNFLLKFYCISFTCLALLTYSFFILFNSLERKKIFNLKKDFIR